MKVAPGRAAGLAALALAACAGDTGTIELRLVTAPGSTVLDGVVTARLTLGEPRTEVEATRGGDGKFRLSLDVAADGPSSNVTFEGEDGGGGLVAYGCSGLLPVAAIDADVSVYVAAPGTLAAAPVALDRPRSEAGTAGFSFGVLVAGGRDGAGAPSAAVDVYSVYSHSLQRGLDLPAPRRAPTVTAGVSGYAYVFGGADAAGAATGDLWRFDVTVAPAGAFQALTAAPTLARIGAAAAPIRVEGFVVTGDPPAVLDGLTGTVTAATGAPALAGTASSVVARSGTTAEQVVMIAGAGTGATGLARATVDGITAEDGPASVARTGHGAAVGADGIITLVGGALGADLATTGIRIDAGSRQAVELVAGLTTPRRDAAVAQTGRLVLVAGGRDASGTLLGDAEVLDAATLAHLATIPMVAARTGATAHTLASGQILIVGGVDGAGAPVGTLELYTPDPAQAFAGVAVGCGR